MLHISSLRDKIIVSNCLIFKAKFCFILILILLDSGSQGHKVWHLRLQKGPDSQPQSTLSH